ncbi:DUF58 domain-containing protein [Acutalibacter caecimuris]|uniref:DUF58 domain-containing protein n=1 Tax=Acutalibacter caecimuris TaxID=3093657 RepID=UPI002AC988D1|nr:DUF58 domain-containing protein [Acutalibacter sp. M00118]
MIPILLLFAALLLLFLLLRRLYDRFWQKGLGCSIQFTQDYAAEGETSVLREVITNRKPLPLPVLEISFHMDRRLQFGDGQNASLSDQTYRRDVFAVAAHQKITRLLDFRCAGRGYFRINETGLTAQDLSLTRRYIGRLPQNTEFYVLPRPVPTAQVQIPYARLMGAVLSRKRVCDDPFAFAGLREYARGDPMKYINWKATARAGQLLVNLHESTLSQRVLFLIDMEGGGMQGGFLNEAGVRLACSLAGRLLAEGVELGLYSNGNDVQSAEPWRLESVSGAGSLLFLQKKLACLEGGPGLPPVCACAPRPAGEDDLLVLISRSLRDDLGEAFAAFTGKGHGLRLIPCGLGTTEENRKALAFHKNVDVLFIEF